MSDPKAFVIIPCYNLGDFLDNEAVDSVLAQTFQDFEILIVNDGSTDEDTKRLLTGYDKPKTRILNKVNEGLPATRNYGIERARGKYVCCLDADDKYHPEFLEKSVAVLEADSDKNLGFVTTWVRVFGEQDFVWKTSSFAPVALAMGNVIHVASLFRRAVWEAVGGYRTNLKGYQDWDFWILLVSKGYAWDVVQEELFYYRDRPGSMVKSSDQKRLELKSQIIQNNPEFFKKYACEIITEYEKRIIHLEHALADSNSRQTILKKLGYYSVRPLALGRAILRRLGK